MLCGNFKFYNCGYLIYSYTLFITDNILEIIEMTNNVCLYSEPSSVIDNISILREIVKKCGFKSNLTTNPNHVKKIDDHLKDAFRR